MNLVLLLYSDNTWSVCYENQIDVFIKEHHWATDIRRDVKIINPAPNGENRVLETYQEFRKRINRPIDKPRDVCYTILTTMERN